MSTEPDGGSPGLLDRLLVPVANPTDAVETAASLQPYSPGHVTVVYVVETTSGAPDKTSVEQSKEAAAASFDAFRGVFPDADDHVAYGDDVVNAVFAAAEELDASAIAYRARDGSRLAQILSGDLSRRLVMKATRPVIALPRTGPDPEP